MKYTNWIINSYNNKESVQFLVLFAIYFDSHVSIQNLMGSFFCNFFQEKELDKWIFIGNLCIISNEYSVKFSVEKLSFCIEGEFYRYFCHFSLDSISISICDLCKDICVHGSIFCTLAFSMIHSSSHNFSVHQKPSMFESEMLDFLSAYALRKLLIGKNVSKNCPW